MSKILDIEVDQGSVWSVTFYVKTDARVPIDVSGRIYKGCAKDDYKNPKINIPFVLYLADQVSHTGGVVWKIEAASTRQLKLSESMVLSYDIKEMYEGNEQIIISGKLILNPRFN